MALDSEVQSQIDELKAEIERLKEPTSLAFPDEYLLRRKSVVGAQDMDEKTRYIHVRNFPSEPELKRANESQNSRWNHIRPDSILVCSMGFHWSGDGFSWNKVCDMVQHTQDAGHYVGLSELQDRCSDPYDALGTMRNEAILMALNEGFEWLLYIDNDVEPEPDVLTRLIQRQHSILSPFIAEPGTGRQLFAPNMHTNTGLQPAKWTVLSMLLFRTSVFNATGPDFWRDPIGADEGFHFQKLWFLGHRPFIDTDIQLVVGGAPHYPLSTNRLPSDERRELWDKINEKRNRPPNRSPMDPDGPHVVDGEYMPWSIPNRDGEIEAGTPEPTDDDMPNAEDI